MTRLALAALLLASPALAGELVPPPAAEVLDRHGQVLRSALPEQLHSVPVALERVSPWALLATLAAEDRRFYEHHGVDPKAVARALWQDAAAGRVVSGGSTITQQLVRALEPRPRTLAGKVKEAWGALRLERRASKREILQAYLDRAPYGRGARGIEAAARVYFGVRAADLTLGQAALLAGLPQSPARLDPVRFPAAAERRRRVVLGRLKGWGWIDESAWTAALVEPLKPADDTRRDLAPHFARRSAAGGGRRTTLDAGLQAELEAVLATHVASLSRSAVTNAALIAVDNASGDVLAWVGSADFRDLSRAGQVDGVTARRQPGSTLKPFAYALAFEDGDSPSTRVDDAPTFAPGGFAPRNYDEEFHGPTTLRQALACSWNAPAVRVAAKVGVGRFLAALREWGFSSLEKDAGHYGAGLVLGNGEVTLLELAGAYAALARGGVMRPLRETPDSPKGPARRVLSREAAYLTSHVLADDAARVSAFGHDSALRLPFPFAAKTGTTKDFKDNWAAGYTPDWTVAVWAGNFDGAPMRRVTGATGAAPILRDAALALERRYGSRPFPVPEGIKEADICPETGALARAECPGAVREPFRRDRLPAQACPLHGPRREAPPEASPAIAFPRPGDVFRLDPATPRAAQRIELRAEPEEGDWTWLLDGKPLPERGPAVWWEPAPGAHRLRALRADGFSEELTFRVLD